MSEQEKPKSFMQELDQWTESNVFAPLLSTDEEGESEEVSEETLEQVKRDIRGKVLESYRNGQAAGGKPQPARKEWRHAKAQTR